MAPITGIFDLAEPRPERPILGRIMFAIHEERLRRRTAQTYRELLCTSDHVLLDLGVTRDDVMLLLDRLESGK